MRRLGFRQLTATRRRSWRCNCVEFWRGFAIDAVRLFWVALGFVRKVEVRGGSTQELLQDDAVRGVISGTAFPPELIRELA
jgi:hypothetical protein